MLWTSACWHPQTYSFVGWRLETIPFWTLWTRQLDIACIILKEKERKNQPVPILLLHTHTLIQAFGSQGWCLSSVFSRTSSLVQRCNYSEGVVSPRMFWLVFWLDKIGNIFTSWMYPHILPTTAFDMWLFSIWFILLRLEWVCTVSVCVCPC